MVMCLGYPPVHNAAAISFYEKCGFSDIGSIEFELCDELHENRILSNMTE